MTGPVYRPEEVKTKNIWTGFSEEEQGVLLVNYIYWQRLECKDDVTCNEGGW